MVGLRPASSALNAPWYSKMNYTRKVLLSLLLVFILPALFLLLVGRPRAREYSRLQAQEKKLNHEIMAKTIELYENKPKRNFLEMIPIKQQYLLFSGIVKLLDNFPDSLIMYCIENKLTMTHLIREMQDIPFEYQKIVDKFDKRIYTPHIQEIRNASSYLKKQGRKPSIASVARLVGTRLDIGPARNRDRRREEVLKAVGL
jgi:hypothetical protein